MARKDDLGPQLRSAGNRRVEVADLKPQEHSVSMSELRIADGAVVMLDIPAMQLKNQPAIGQEPFIIRPAVVAPTAEQPLIPAAAGFNVLHTNERLRLHAEFVASYFSVCTSTEKTGGRSRTIGFQVLPLSAEQ